MKRAFILSFAAIALMFVVGFAGCTSEKIQVIHNDNVITNSTSIKAFNDETYVWESWTIGTNKVHSID